MKTYLVGGAVRDKLLGLKIKERDWVVVGARPEDLLKQGFQQVGRDFPVFLHPESREEYALARTERKSGKGYYGFNCNSSPEISLEEDLLRRDLTINAMALTEDGELIDPYGGRRDLADKILRHVSPTFVEDPVRVLRLARFAARFEKLGFKVANETRQLMYDMVRKKELDHLVPERIWQEWQRSLEEDNPEIFIKVLRSCDALKVIFPELDKLFGVPNPKKYHPEIDSGVHSLLSLEAASKLSSDPIVRFGAILHDLGKALTPHSQWPKHRGHEQLGLAPIQELCKRLRLPSNYRDFALLCSRFHLTIHRISELKPGTILNLLEQSDFFRRPEQLRKLLLVCEADARGAGLEGRYQQAQAWKAVMDSMKQVSVTPLLAKGLKGEQIKSALHQQRSKKIRALLPSLHTIFQ